MGWPLATALVLHGLALVPGILRFERPPSAPIYVGEIGVESGDGQKRKLRKHRAAIGIGTTHAPQPAVSPNEIAGSEDVGLRDAYFAELRAAIERNKSYPALALEQGERGRVVVGFSILEDGSLVDIRIQESSHSALLDEAAIETIQKTEKAPRPPLRAMNVHVPLDFEIE